jgi:serine/threonine protein kinase
MSSLIGRVVLGRYRILCLLGRGGMGEVYLARSEGAAGFFKPVVVKRVLAEHADNKDIIGMLQREARIMSTLRHPNIVSVLDFGQDRSDQILVIEYVHGFHLGRWRRWTVQKERPFPVERAVQIALEVLAALEHAHTARGPDASPLGIVHRDVSPANVLIDAEGTVKLADFGVARMEGEHTVLDGSQPTVKGKFPYIAPELFEGVAANAATDVYSAAVVLDEVLRGVNAFKTGQMSETVGRVLSYVPDPLDTVRDDVSSELADIVSRAIDKDPRHRYASAAELAAALRSVREGTEDDAKRELASAARRDFFHPSIGPDLDLPSLASLEELWHGPAPPEPAEEPIVVERRLSSPPTVPAWRPTAGRFTLLALAGLGVAGIAAVAIWFFTRPAELDTGGRQLFVVVDRTASDAGAPASPVTHEEPDAGAIEARSDEPATPDAGRAGVNVRPRPRSVEAPFRSRSTEISRCFSTHVRELEGSPEIVVHFVVRADGSVERAAMTPAELGGTALGRCILGVATSTRFAPNESAVSFRVPLGARRVGG